MRRHISIAVLGSAMLLVTADASAETLGKGFGIGTNLNFTGGAQGVSTAVEEVHLAFNAGQFRVAPFVGFTHFTSGGVNSDSLKLSGGTGLFYCLQPLGPVVGYLGPTYRFGYHDAQVNGTEFLNERNVYRHDLGALIGVEYWAHPALTFGIEFGAELGYQSDDQNLVSQTQVSVGAAFTVRWYID